MDFYFYLFVHTNGSSKGKNDYLINNLGISPKIDYPAISKKNKNRFGMFKANNSGLHESRNSLNPGIPRRNIP